jgi:predicted alpha/beta-fold hydrolase
MPDGTRQLSLANSLVPTRTTWDFDAAYAAGMAGLPHRDTYYAKCSCGRYDKTAAEIGPILTTVDDTSLAPGASPRG